MIVSTIYYAPQFIRDLKKLPSFKQRIAAEREKVFKKDPFTPTLKTHKLSGRFDEYWAFSITYQDRIIFRFVDSNEVIFFKIGSHDIYK